MKGIIVLIGGFLAITFFYFMQRKEVLNLRSANKLKDQIISTRNQLFYEYVLHNINGSLHSLQDIRAISEDREDVSIKSIINTSPKVVLFLSDKSCESCQISAIELMENFSAQIGSNKCIILSKYENFDQLIALKSNLKHEIKAYNLKNAVNINKDLYDSNSVYFFFVTSNLNVTSIMVHRLSDPESTEIYLRSVKKYLQ